MSTADPVKRRNYRVVGIVGGLLLPLAGAVGAAMFYANGDRDLAASTAFASAGGALLYVLAFSL